MDYFYINIKGNYYFVLYDLNDQHDSLRFYSDLYLLSISVVFDFYQLIFYFWKTLASVR